MKSLKLLSAVLVLGSAAHASVLTYFATLNGANEIPANGSTATGSAVVTVDTVANTIGFVVAFSGLGSNAVAAHIHCCQPLGTNAAVATVPPAFPGFPVNGTSGIFNTATPFNLLDPAFYNAPFLAANGGGTAAGAETALLAGLAAGQTYFNIHTANFPGGEIRGQLAAIPEPATIVLAGLALAGLGITIRRTRKYL